MYILHSCEYRLLRAPLRNMCGYWNCWKVAANEESLWFAQFWSHGKPVSLRIFDREKEFELFYKQISKIYRDENKETDIPLYDVSELEESNIPF